MPDLSFSISGARAEKRSAVPTLTFRLHVRETTREPMQALLQVQIQIQPRRRKYLSAEQERLAGLFGAAERWNETLRPFHWATVPVFVPEFEGEAELDLAVPCTYDLEVASARYFDALEDGEIGLLFLFSGTVFTKIAGGFLFHRVPWEKEAAFRLPVGTWREAIDAHFPGCGWIRLSRSNLQALERVKTRDGLFNWDEVIESLISGAKEAVR
jgi:hypothetical protein